MWSGASELWKLIIISDSIYKGKGMSNHLLLLVIKTQISSITLFLRYKDIVHSTIYRQLNIEYSKTLLTKLTETDLFLMHGGWRYAVWKNLNFQLEPNNKITLTPYNGGPTSSSDW